MCVCVCVWEVLWFKLSQMQYNIPRIEIKEAYKILSITFKSLQKGEYNFPVRILYSFSRSNNKKESIDENNF